MTTPLGAALSVVLTARAPRHRPLPSPLQVELPTGLSVVPGPAAGEGCNVTGGCASCPFMKMNSLQVGGARGVTCNQPYL